MNNSFRAFHGTLESRLSSILTDGFQPSVHRDDWLGRGTYFFLDGLSDGRKSAEDWAICASWDKAARRFLEDRLSIIEVEIMVSNECVLDLREHKRMRDFHNFRHSWFEEKYYLNASSFDTRPSSRRHDSEVLMAFAEEMGIDVLICNFHIQLALRERFLRLDSRVPNVTTMCLVGEPHISAQYEVANITTKDFPECLGWEENAVW